MRLPVFVLTLLFAASAAAASKNYVDVRKITPDKFEARADAIRKAIRNDQFVLERDEAALVDARLDEMSKLLEGVGDLGELEDAKRVKLFNAQEEVNAILTANSGDRKICEHRPRLGSHRKEVHCETVAERKTRQSHTREKSRQMFGEAKLQCDADGCQ